MKPIARSFSGALPQGRRASSKKMIHFVDEYSARPAAGSFDPHLLFTFLLAMAVLLPVTVCPVLAQGFEISQTSEAPVYYYDIYTSASRDSGLVSLNLSTKIAYDQMQFVRSTDGLFRAEYELSVSIVDQDGDQTESRILDRNIEVAEFEQTNQTTSFDLAQVQFELEPGKYELVLGLMDKDSKRTGRHKLDLELLDYWAHDFGMSDILLADSISVLADSSFYGHPNVFWNLADAQEQVFLMFDVYSKVNWETIPIGLTVRSKNETAISISREIPLGGFRNPVILSLKREDLKPGRYRLEVVVGRDKAVNRRVKDLTVRWIGLPASTFDLDEAIEQLQYIAKGDALNKIKKAEGPEKRRLYSEYWKSLDPTPATEINELMDEYYRRIGYANQNFGAQTDGWNTDRGMVYVILGAPNDVERHPFEMEGKPYEVWTYYQMNRQFVFIDQTGFGDYRLVNNLWEVFRRQ